MSSAYSTSFHSYEHNFNHRTTTQNYLKVIFRHLEEYPPLSSRQFSLAKNTTNLPHISRARGTVPDQSVKLTADCTACLACKDATSSRHDVLICSNRPPLSQFPNVLGNFGLQPISSLQLTLAGCLQRFSLDISVNQTLLSLLGSLRFSRTRCGFLHAVVFHW